jgi:hypothetical protein
MCRCSIFVEETHFLAVESLVKDEAFPDPGMNLMVVIFLSQSKSATCSSNLSCDGIEQCFDCKFRALDAIRDHGF